jgi:putative glycosyltransferase (TIGR04372 family)
MKKKLKLIIYNYINKKLIFYIFIIYLFLKKILISSKYKKIVNKTNKNKNFILNKNLGKKHIDRTKSGKLINYIQNIENLLRILRLSNLDNNFLFVIKHLRSFYKYNDSQILNYSLNNFLIFIFKKNKKLLFLIFLIKIKNFNYILKIKKSFDAKYQIFINLWILTNLHHNKYNKNISLKLVNYFSKSKNFEIIRLAEIFSENYLCEMNTHINNFKKINISKKLNEHKIFGSTFYAFGHLLSFLEKNYRSKYDKDDYYKNCRIIISPYYLSNSLLGNYIKSIFENKCIISHSKFLESYANEKFSFFELDEHFNNKYSYWRLPFYECTEKKIISPSIDIKKIEGLSNKINNKECKVFTKYIVIYFRSASFKKENTFDLFNRDRESSSENIETLIKYLIKKNYNVIIMGNSEQKKISFNHNNLYDYAHSKYKNDYNDILLPAKSEFIINFGLSGTKTIGLSFGKFELNIDYPLNRKHCYNNRAFYLPKLLKYKGTDCKVDAYYSNELMFCHSGKVLEDLGYKQYFNNTNFLLSAFDEFEICYKTKNTKLTKYLIKDNWLERNILNLK